MLWKNGIKFSNDPDFRKMDKGICVLHATLFHPAMKNVGPIKELVVKTFNMLLP
jgi:anthranilate phosphoribosyltransferase